MTRPLKLALFTDTFDETNGVAHTYRMLADFCVRTGRHLDIYCPSDRTLTENHGTVNIRRFQHSIGVRYYDQLKFSVLPNEGLFETFAASGQYDLVHLAAPGSIGSWGRTLAKKFKLPTVAVHHTNLHDYAALRVPKLFASTARDISLAILRRFYRPCRTILVTTPKMGEWVTRNRLCQRTDLFSRGVDCSLFQPRLVIERPGPVRFIYVGRLSVEKNLNLLADVLNKVRQTCDIEMSFVGDGVLRSDLQKQCPWAEFPGYLKGSDLSRAYSESDVFVFPSLTDTYGNVVNEAQASGLPCLVMDRRGPGEVIEPEKTGFITPTAELLEEKMSFLAKNAAVRQNMGREARKLAETRDWDTVFSGLFQTYAQVARQE